jgi:hypothetical protein
MYVSIPSSNYQLCVVKAKDRARSVKELKQLLTRKKPVYPRTKDQKKIRRVSEDYIYKEYIQINFDSWDFDSWNFDS